MKGTINGHPLYLAEAKVWDDLFEATAFRKEDAPPAIVVELPGIGPKPTERMEVGPYCMIDRSQVGGPSHDSAWLRMRRDRWEELVCTRGVLGVEHDRMHFNVVVWNDHEALVILCHGLIIGNIWLAVIDPATIPVRP